MATTLMRFGVYVDGLRAALRRAKVVELGFVYPLEDGGYGGGSLVFRAGDPEAVVSAAGGMIPAEATRLHLVVDGVRMHPLRPDAFGDSPVDMVTDYGLPDPPPWVVAGDPMHGLTRG